MKNFHLIICLTTIFIGFSQDSVKKDKKLVSPFEKVYNDTNSKYSKYAKASSNNIYYNTGFGESKYDKDINFDTDINPNDVKGSIEKFRTKKRNEEILWFIKIIGGFLVVFSLSYLIYNLIKKN